MSKQMQKYLPKSILKKYLEDCIFSRVMTISHRTVASVDSQTIGQQSYPTVSGRLWISVVNLWTAELKAEIFKIFSVAEVVLWNSDWSRLLNSQLLLLYKHCCLKKMLSKLSHHHHRIRQLSWPILSTVRLSNFCAIVILSAVLHSGRTLVCDRRTFHVPRSICSWWVTTYVGKPSATRSTN